MAKYRIVKNGLNEYTVEEYKIQNWAPYDKMIWKYKMGGYRKLRDAEAYIEREIDIEKKIKEDDRLRDQKVVVREYDTGSD